MNKTRRRLQKARRRAEETEAWLRGFHRRYASFARDLDALAIVTEGSAQ